MPNDDYIKRSDALNELYRGASATDPMIKVAYRVDVHKRIESIPAADVEPKRKTGSWTEVNMYFDQYAWRCSVCGEDWDLIEGTPFENNMRFCPKCGAEMIAEVPKGEDDV